MTPERLLGTAIVPALQDLDLDSPIARVILLAIAFQESGLNARQQAGYGPAMGYWQFEKSGCSGVLTHKVSGDKLVKLLVSYDVVPEMSALWQAIKYNDIVAAATARLLILTYPGKLPTTAVEGWNQYLALWRPGKPRPETWDSCWTRAEHAISR